MLPRPGSKKVEIALRFLLLIILVCVLVPFKPSMPALGLDQSWVLSMNQAVSQKLRIGTDVIFTFGPYASIYTKAYHPATDIMILAGSMFLAVSCWLSTIFVTRNKAKILLALCITLWISIFSLDALLLFIPFLGALVAYRASEESLCASQQSNKTLFVMALAFLAIGLIPVIKGSLLILSLAIALSSAILFLLRRQNTLALISLLVPAASTVVFWWASGQNLVDLPNYFINMAPIASGYTEAMAIPGKNREVFLYIIATTLIMTAIVNFNRLSFSVSNAFLTAIYSLYLFMCFKAGFVRHDGHALAAGVAILLASITLQTFQKSRLTTAALIFAILTFAIIFNRHTGLSIPVANTLVKETFGAALQGIERRVSDSAWPENEFEANLAHYKELAPLPLLPGRSDIYSYNQTQLIASGNTWAPRPTFQSYSAYTPTLEENNNEHIIGKNAPDNIFFRVEPIDERLPSMEDGASWPALLTYYSPIELLPDYLVLAKRKVRPTLEMQTGNIVEHQMGEEVTLPETHNAIVAKIDIKPTVFGRLANIIYKPSQLDIKLKLKNGDTREYRIVSGMLKSGVIISPLIENTREFGSLYNGSGFLNNKEVKAITITQHKKSTLFWESKYSLQLNEMKLPEDLDNSKVFGFETIDKTASSMPIIDIKKCEGYIDVLNGSVAQSPVNITGLLSASGWLASSVAEGTLPEAVYIILTDLKGDRTFIKAKPTSRIDVAVFLKKPSLAQVGYSVSFDTKKLHGDYRLQLAMKRSGRIEVCPEYSISAKINDQVN